MFRKNVEGSLLKLSPWRKISLATWDKPSDPSVYGLLEIDATNLLKKLDAIKKESGQKMTLTPFLIKGVAMTLAKYPTLNVIIRKNRIYTRKHVDVFAQVFFKTEENPDLSGAKIREAHTKTLSTIYEELTKQSEKIRSGNDPNLKQPKSFLRFLSPTLLKWSIRALSFLSYDLNVSPSILKMPPDPFGAAMVTNIGIFGLKTAWAPLVPFSRTPMVLVVGEITDQPIAKEGQVVVRPILNIGVTVDHRIIDGYLAGKASAYLKKLLEEPELLT